MPVLRRRRRDQFEAELRSRFEALMEALEQRELMSPREGCKGRSYWVHPEVMCATEGNEIEIRLAVADFQAVLSEVKRLK